MMTFIYGLCAAACCANIGLAIANGDGHSATGWSLAALYAAVIAVNSARQS